MINLSGLTSTHVGLTNINGTGSIIGQTVFPVVLDDHESVTLTTQFSGAAGDEVCFQVNLYNQQDSLNIFDCCLSEEVYCFTLPNCQPQNRPETIRLFPNPASDGVTVYFREGSLPGTRIRIRDLTGRTMQETDIESGLQGHLIPLRLLPTGMYSLEVISQGEKVFVEKLIKK